LPEHRGWYSRGYLPHRDEPGLVQAITFHLADSLPLALLRDHLPPPGEGAAQRAYIQSCLDRGWGACLLADHDVAAIVENALLFWDSERYSLIAWVVMPNHVHVLIETLPGHPLDRVLHSWKSYTSKQVNALRQRQGSFWRREYYDRYVRDAKHLGDAIRYVHNNPVKAGLVERPEDWLFGSGRLVETVDSPYHVPSMLTRKEQS